MSSPSTFASRRRFLQLATGTLAAGALSQFSGSRGPAATAFAAGKAQSAESTQVPVRQITQGPKFHWFGYYDKLQFDPTCRYVLGNEVDFEHRSPKADDVIRVGMVDLQDGDRWIELGESRAWNWQQGCMLQWLPGSKSEVVFNDRQGDRFVCHVLDVFSGKRRTIPHPVYALSPDGRTAVTCDFRRLNDTRPGYGYAGIADPVASELAPKDAGIWQVDLETGDSKLLLSFAEAARLPNPPGAEPAAAANAKHWFNHLLVSPNGERFIFLHRWRVGEAKGFSTRMFTGRLDGSDLRVIDPSGKTSHFIWRDPEHILAWTWHASHGDGFYLFEDRENGAVEIVGKGVMPVNGHCTYLPGNEWILNDTYPNRQREQEVYLYHVPSGRKVSLGKFPSPKQYQGEWRCDTHPRFSPDGRTVVIDSPHNAGRQMHLIDISQIVGVGAKS
ncbi:MAG: hypothetical protein ACOY3P_06535 [Planctomycetota bacterium]